MKIPRDISGAHITKDSETDRRKLLGEFLLRCLQADNIKQQFQIAAGRGHSFWPTEGDYRPGAYPNSTHKSTIKCLAIERQNNELMKLTSGVIDRLREYRAALITAAVTAQLDIREHEKKLEAHAERNGSEAHGVIEWN